MTETKPDYLKEARQMWVNNPSMHSPESTILGDILSHLEQQQTPAQTPPATAPEPCSHPAATLRVMAVTHTEAITQIDLRCSICGAITTKRL